MIKTVICGSCCTIVLGCENLKLMWFNRSSQTKLLEHFSDIFPRITPPDIKLSKNCWSKNSWLVRVSGSVWWCYNCVSQLIGNWSDIICIAITILLQCHTASVNTVYDSKNGTLISTLHLQMCPISAVWDCKLHPAERTQGTITHFQTMTKHLLYDSLYYHGYMGSESETLIHFHTILNFCD